MGDYTKIVFDAKILPGNRPIETFLERVGAPYDLRAIPDRPEHSFFKAPRWHMLFRGCGSLTTGQYAFRPADEYEPATVHINSCLKNYSSEIRLFLDWAHAWAVAEYIYGYTLDEYDAPMWISHEGNVINRRTELLT